MQDWYKAYDCLRHTQIHRNKTYISKNKCEQGIFISTADTSILKAFQICEKIYETLVYTNKIKQFMKKTIVNTELFTVQYFVDAVFVSFLF